MADSKNKNYGGITPAADAKKQQGKMPPNANFSETVDAMQGHVRQQVKETGKTIETSESVLNVQKSLNDALRGMSQAVGRGVISQKQQQDLLKQIVSQNSKAKGDGGLNPAKIAQMVATITAKQAKQVKVPTLQKGGSVSKTGLAKIHAGESVFPKGSLEELVSLMKDQVYYIKQISGFYDDVKIPDMLKLDEKSFGKIFKDWIKGGLYSAFPTFIKIGKAVIKPFYRLFKARGGTYVYASHLSKAESPFRQISENIGILYTGSMLHMDRMINIQKATAEAVRDLATYTIPGKTYAAIDDIKPSKKWRAITAIAKGVGKGILGLGGAALGGMAGMAMGGPWGALAGAAGGGMLGYKKGGTMLKGAGKVVGRSIMGKDVVTDEEFKRFRKWKEEKKGGLKFWTKEARAKRAAKKGEDLSDFGDFASGGLGATKKGAAAGKKGKEKGIQVEISLSSIKNLSKATSVQPLGIRFAKVKSKFSKKNKDNVIDIALNPESQKALDQIKDTSKQAADTAAKEAKGGGIGGFISTIMPFLPLALGFIKGLPGMIMGWVTSALGSVGSWVLKKGVGVGWNVLSFLGRNVFKFLLGTVVGKLLMSFAVGYGIGTLINKYLIQPFLEAKEKRDDIARAVTEAKTREAAKGADAKAYQNVFKEGSPEELVKKLREADLTRITTNISAEERKSLEEKDKRSIGATWWSGPDFVRDVIAKQHEFMRDHIDEYRGYDPMEIEKLKIQFNQETPLAGFWQTDPAEVAKEREAKFRDFVKKKLKKMEPMQLSEREVSVLQKIDKQQPGKSNIETVIKAAKETAAKSLVDTYGLSTTDAQKYVDMAAKAYDPSDVRNLTNAGVLTQTAQAYMDQEKTKRPGEKPTAGAPSDYGKTSAINEANQAAMTTDAVKQGVSEGMKPGLAEQAKAISSAVNLSTSSGVNNQISNNSTTSTNANTNYNFPGSKDAWSEQAQRGNIPR